MHLAPLKGNLPTLMNYKKHKYKKRYSTESIVPLISLIQGQKGRIRESMRYAGEEPRGKKEVTKVKVIFGIG